MANPLHLFLLEVAYSSFKARSFGRRSLANSLVGVFVGLFSVLPRPTSPSFQLGKPEGLLSLYEGTANSVSIASGRISYVLGLTGPCFPVDSACSSSLVAAHVGAAAVNQAECVRACVVAGGVLETYFHIAFSTAGMLSARGRCHTFDSRADGYSRGEGSVSYLCEAGGAGAASTTFASSAIR